MKPDHKRDSILRNPSVVCMSSGDTHLCDSDFQFFLYLGEILLICQSKWPSLLNSMRDGISS